MAGAATIRALVNGPRAEREIRGSRARSGSRGSCQDYDGPGLVSNRLYRPRWLGWQLRAGETRDRKSTRLNSSHSQISYAVFCLKKKKKKTQYCVSKSK